MRSPTPPDNRLHAVLRPAALLLWVTLSVFALSACTTSANYRLANDDIPAAEPLNYSNSGTHADIQLISVIVPRGPGSWKQNALWDEYLVSLSNPGSGPLRVESVSLLDLADVEQMPGVEQWQLEKLSEANWKKYQRMGRFALDAAGVAGSILLPSFAYGLTGATSGLLTAIPIVAVSTVAVVTVLDRKNKTLVEQKFDSRRIKLPLDLAAGTVVQGSLFFPVVPGPQRLILRGRAGAEDLVLELDLKPLAGLHLTPSKP